MLLREIEIVGEPGAPVIAIGSKVWDFLKKNSIECRKYRCIFTVLHYSNDASRYRKLELEKYPEDSDVFLSSEFGKESRWSSKLTCSKKQLAFTYYRKFERV